MKNNIEYRQKHIKFVAYATDNRDVELKFRKKSFDCDEDEFFCKIKG